MANTVWNRKRNYQIPDSLTHATGTISAVFGTTTFTVSLTGLTVNTLYYLYIRKISGISTLVSVTTIPSVFRATYSDALLIGAFYSNGLSLVEFGSFVNIEGVPKSNNPIVSILPIDAGSPFTYSQITWTRHGRDFLATLSALKDGTAGSGATLFSINLPTNLPNFAVVDGTASPLTEISQMNGGNIGYFSATGINGTVDWIDLPIYINTSNTNQLYTLMQPSGTGTLPKSSIGAGAVLQGFITPLPIVSWSNTPLKDL